MPSSSPYNTLSTQRKEKAAYAYPPTLRTLPPKPHKTPQHHPNHPNNHHPFTPNSKKMPTPPILTTILRTLFTSPSPSPTPSTSPSTSLSSTSSSLPLSSVETQTPTRPPPPPQHQRTTIRTIETAVAEAEFRRWGEEQGWSGCRLGSERREFREKLFDGEKDGSE